MHLSESDDLEDEEGGARRAIHDIAAAIISVRALAEVLAEHLPTLVAVSRSRLASKEALLPTATLDSLPSIPKEIIDLCTRAQGSLRAFGSKSSAMESVAATSTDRLVHTENQGNGTFDKKVGRKDARVLLVEDDESFQYVLSQRLQAQGYLVTNASDGEEALTLLDQMDFDLVLMDLRLRGMSGCETTKRLRARESAQGCHTCIVGLTASPLLEDQVLAKAAGMDDVLTKPINDVALRLLLSQDN